VALELEDLGQRAEERQVAKLDCAAALIAFVTEHVQAIGCLHIRTDVLVADDEVILRAAFDLVMEREGIPVDLLDAEVCILGYAFLENSDDTRNTPARSLYELLKEDCTDVVVHDPYVDEEKGVVLTKDLEGALKGKHAVILVTKHDEYNALTPEKLKGLLANPVIIDGRNVYDQNAFKEAGFVYRGVGKGTIYRN